MDVDLVSDDFTVESCNDCFSGRKVQRPNVPNLSKYSECSLVSMVEMTIKMLHDTEGTTVLSHKQDYERLSRDLLVKTPNEATAKAMVALGNYLVHFKYRHEALYFYHAAIRFCDSLA